jgi:adenylate kinase
MNLIILGPPGSGKGTQAKLIAQKYNLAHLSSGQLLRQLAEQDTPKGKKVASLIKTGELLPFETVLEAIEAPLLAAETGFVLDGVPRNQAQAEYMDTFFEEHDINLDLVIYLSLSDRETMTRLLKRGAEEGRSDDIETTIKERLRVYHLETVPIIEHYRQQGKLMEVDGAPSIEEIFADISEQLDKKFPQQE